jgi:hypothetical protein
MLVRKVSIPFAALVDLFLFPVIACIAIASSLTRKSEKLKERPRIVWGSTPIVNNAYWSRAMKTAGYSSTTYMFNSYGINERSDFDRVLLDEYRWCPLVLRPYLAFIVTLANYDVVITSFSGFMLVTPFLRRIQGRLFRLAGIKTVVMPFGSDAYVYSRIRSTGTIQGLLFSYPQAAREQKRISRDVDYWCSKADVVVAGVMGPDGLGRWDVPTPSALSIDTSQWQVTARNSTADGSKFPVVVAHAPNHRGFKGTEFVIDAIRKLQSEGLLVELRLLEGLPNKEVRRVLATEIDVLVEQLIFTGHGMNGLEGMASGLPVICNLEDDQYLLPFRRWSFFGECPLVSASPESLQDVLRTLITQPSLRHELGALGRQYVEKYHGLDSSQYLFSNVIDYLYGRRESISDLYHPLTSEFNRRLPTIVPPLDKNRLRTATNK